MKQVICIDAKNNHQLVADEIYDVEWEDYHPITRKKFYGLKGLSGDFAVERFVVAPPPVRVSGIAWDMFPGLDEETRQRVAKIIHGTLNANPTPPQDEEERLRDLLKPATLPTECPCGIQRARCDYHKD